MEEWSCVNGVSNVCENSGVKTVVCEWFNVLCVVKVDERGVYIYICRFE